MWHMVTSAGSSSKRSPVASSPSTHGAATAMDGHRCFWRSPMYLHVHCGGHSCHPSGRLVRAFKQPRRSVCKGGVLCGEHTARLGPSCPTGRRFELRGRLVCGSGQTQLPVAFWWRQMPLRSAGTAVLVFLVVHASVIHGGATGGRGHMHSRSRPSPSLASHGFMLALRVRMCWRITC